MLFLFCPLILENRVPVVAGFQDAALRGRHRSLSSNSSAEVGTRRSAGRAAGREGCWGGRNCSQEQQFGGESRGCSLLLISEASPQLIRLLGLVA